MSEILSQSEIDALLAALSTGEVKAEDIKSKESDKKIKPYDFKRPDKFSKEQLHTLSMIHENFARLLTTYLSAQLRTLVQINVFFVEQMTYNEFIISVSNPSLIAVIDFSPLKGAALIEINPTIAFAIIIICIIGFVGQFLTVNPLHYIESRFMSFSSDGGSGRFQIWKNAIDTFVENPIFGIGINATRNYNMEVYSRGVYVHNTLLEVLVESGIVGLIIYLLFWISLLENSYKIYKFDNKTSYVFTTLISMFLQMFSLSILYNEAFYLVLLILYKIKNLQNDSYNKA